MQVCRGESASSSVSSRDASCRDAAHCFSDPLRGVGVSQLGLGPGVSVSPMVMAGARVVEGGMAGRGVPGMAGREAATGPVRDTVALMSAPNSGHYGSVEGVWWGCRASNISNFEAVGSVCKIEPPVAGSSSAGSVAKKATVAFSESVSRFAWLSFITSGFSTLLAWNSDVSLYLVVAQIRPVMNHHSLLKFPPAHHSSYWGGTRRTRSRLRFYERLRGGGWGWCTSWCGSWWSC